MEQNTNIQQKPKGSTYLKVVGILMIIGGALGIVLSIVAILGIAVLAAAADTSGGILYLAGILALVSSVAELIAGIIGVKNCNRPEKANTCIAWGIIVAVFSIIGNILTVVGGGSFSIVNCLTGLLLPVLFIIGAALNKKA